MRRRKPPRESTARIEDISHDGRGVARVDGKTVFVDGALPGELATFRHVKPHRKFDEAQVLSIENASTDRVAPRCAHFGTCGGCTMQHLSSDAQVRAKQKVLADNLERIGKVAPKEWLRPLTAEVWGYRRRARLGVKWVRRKQRMLVGFRERHSPHLAEIESCQVLDAKVGGLLRPLAELVTALSIPERIPQFEVSVADNAVAIVVRHLDPLTPDDLQKLATFGQKHGIRFYLQPKGPDSIAPLEDNDEPLYFDIPAHDVRLQFEPGDFIQVNRSINNAMIDHALALLELDGKQDVLDLFCGLGNFSLPIARHAASVTGVEGDESLVKHARENATRNNISNAEFFTANLFEDVRDFAWAKRDYDRVLLDPPRAGAEEICRRIERFSPGRHGPERIVYVSCHPGTLARDAGILVHEKGYELEKAGVMDMFPHTAHVESIAVFTRS
ncbi:MAG TPA: 23S rRNA (uracil(1939)-C(5))-methyltransferase RlmD [Gammaproteobacteria bacterium]